MIRSITGSANPDNVVSGSIRGNFVLDIIRNIVHASDSLEFAQREIDLYFNYR